MIRATQDGKFWWILLFIALQTSSDISTAFEFTRPLSAKYDTGRASFDPARKIGAIFVERFYNELK